MYLEISPSFLLNFSECEMNGEEKIFYQFKSFRLDVDERQLLHNDLPVSLTPKAFDVLTVLVERNGHLVEKDELLRNVWSDSFVEEANVARIVHTLRKVLGEDENGNKFIETVAKKGYRFVAEVDEVRELITQKFTNGNQSSIAIAENFFETTAAEKLPETEFQTLPPASPIP
jgi:DNA-binding winged helix-turn-helix (wHTH) protein